MERKCLWTAFMKVPEARTTKGREVLEIGLLGCLGWRLSHYCAPITVLSFLGAAPGPRQISRSPRRKQISALIARAISALLVPKTSPGKALWLI